MVAYRLCKSQADKKIIQLRAKGGSISSNKTIKEMVGEFYQKIFQIIKSPTAIYEYLFSRTIYLNLQKNKGKSQMAL